MQRSSLWMILLLVAAALALGLALLPRRKTAASVRNSATPRLAATKAAAPPAPHGSSDDPSAIYFAKNAAPIPPFLLQALDGQVISTAALRGKVVLLAFWATWCPPCREEIPELIELANRYKDQLVIVGISEDDAPPDEIRLFAKQAGMNYPVIMASPELEAEYGGVPALPTTFVADRDGKIVQKHVGLYPISIYDAEIRALLGQPVKSEVRTFQDTGQIFLRNAANATELPGVSFAGLNAQQKAAALKILNSRTCTCGCGLTLAQCRINDTTCPVSKELAAKIVRDIARGAPAAPSSPAPAAHTEPIARR